MVKVNHARAIICYVCHIDRVYAAAPLLSPPNPPSLKSEVSRLGRIIQGSGLVHDIIIIRDSIFSPPRTGITIHNNHVCIEDISARQAGD